MLQQNDVLMIGPYKYKVLETKGRFARISWITKEGVHNELWLMIKATPTMIKAAA